MAENKTYRWNGAYGQPGTSGPNGRTTKSNGNKGIMKAYRATKRAAAETRNKLTLPGRKRAAARAAGFRRHSDRIRAGK